MKRKKWEGKTGAAARSACGILQPEQAASGEMSEGRRQEGRLMGEGGGGGGGGGTDATSAAGANAGEGNGDVGGVACTRRNRAAGKQHTSG